MQKTRTPSKILQRALCAALESLGLGSRVSRVVPPWRGFGLQGLGRRDRSLDFEGLAWEPACAPCSSSDGLDGRSYFQLKCLHSCFGLQCGLHGGWDLGANTARLCRSKGRLDNASPCSFFTSRLDPHRPLVGRRRRPKAARSAAAEGGTKCRPVRPPENAERRRRDRRRLPVTYEVPPSKNTDAILHG